MTDIAAALVALNALLTNMGSGILLLIIVLVLNILFFWLYEKRSSIFFYLMLVPIDLVYGLSYASGQTVASAGWVTGIIIAIVGMACLFRVAANELMKAREKRGR